MSISKKFFLVFFVSIIFIILTNIFAFFIFYNSYFKFYLVEKSEISKEITLDYINNLLKVQVNEQIDDLFSNSEIEFFELLQESNGKITLDKEKNRDIVTNYLVKMGLTPNYIEEVIPTDSFSKVVNKMRTKDSPEYNFLHRFLTSAIITNICAIFIIMMIFYFFTRNTIFPLKALTNKIQKFDFNKRNNTRIEYSKNDEIGLLVKAINNLNENLNIQDDIRNKMLADISHELKTPITSIQCYLEGISDGVITLDDKTLNSIIDEMKRLISLVNKIMEYEKFDTTEIVPNLEKTELVELLKELSNTNKKRLGENNQRIKISGLESVKIKLDPNLFKQIVYNVISNFIKYAGEGTILNIIVGKNYVDFSDNGKGIPSKEIQFVTQKFYQSKNNEEVNKDEKGLGIGLNLIQKIIDSHGWNYKIKSDIGKGFSLKIIFK